MPRSYLLDGLTKNDKVTLSIRFMYKIITKTCAIWRDFGGPILTMI